MKIDDMYVDSVLSMASTLCYRKVKEATEHEKPVIRYSDDNLYDMDNWQKVYQHMREQENTEENNLYVHVQANIWNKYAKLLLGSLHDKFLSNTEILKHYYHHNYLALFSLKACALIKYMVENDVTSKEEIQLFFQREEKCQ